MGSGGPGGQEVRRYELLSAADYRPAYRGDFTRTLIETLRRGITSVGATIDANDLREPLHDGAQEQRPQRVTIDGGGWAQRGDPGLWLAYNSVLYSADDNAASAPRRPKSVSSPVTCSPPTPSTPWSSPPRIASV